MFCSIIENGAQLTAWMKSHTGLYDFVKALQDIHEETDYRFYIVGGFVRDWVLGGHSMDLDIAVEGDIRKVMASLSESCELEYTYYERFKTATFILTEGTVDLVTCRSESYSFDGALPTVFSGNIEDDLARRDFSVNALAIDLCQEPWKICGLDASVSDLERKTIRVLHNRSFQEDPTRLFRAVRYKNRLGFTYEAVTLDLIHQAVEKGYLRNISADRILQELSKILKEGKSFDILEDLVALGIDKWILPDLQLPQVLKRALKNMEGLELTFIEDTESFDPVELRMLTILYYNTDRAWRFVERFRLSRRFANMIEDLTTLVDQVKSIQSSIQNAEVYHLLHKVPDEVLFVLYLCTDHMLVKNIIERYYIKLKDQKNVISGNDLKELGVSSGPQMRTLLSKVFKGLLNGEINDRTEALEYLNRYIEKD